MKGQVLWKKVESGIILDRNRAISETFILPINPSLQTADFKPRITEISFNFSLNYQ